MNADTRLSPGITSMAKYYLRLGIELAASGKLLGSASAVS